MEVFKLAGCQRLEEGNHIPVLVDRLKLENLGLQESDKQGTPRYIVPNFDVVYLHGRHRVEAAKQFLHPDDRWWVVDVYDQCLSFIPTFVLVAETIF